MTTTRRTLLATGAGLSGLALAGCLSTGGGESGGGSGESGAASSGGGDDGPLEGSVKFWTINLRKNFQAYFDQLIADFEDQNPEVTVEWVDVPGQEMQTKYLAALTTGDVPDAVNVDSKNLGQLATTFADIEGIFSEEELAVYQPGLVDGLRVQGTLYGIPWYNSGTLVGVWRKSTMDEVGFDPSSPPQSWEEALDLADEVHEATGVYGTNTDPSMRRLQAMGVEFVNEDLTEATFATEDAANLVSRFQESYAGGGIAPGASALDAQEPQTVANGQIAFQADMGPGQITTLQNDAPDAYADIYVTTSPRDQNGNDQMTGQHSMAVPAQSENPAAGAAFIKFMTSAEAQLAFCELVPIFPSAKETLEAPLFTEEAGDDPAEQARRIVVENFPNAVDTTVQLPPGIPDQIRQDFIMAMKETMRSGDDPAPVLETQQAAWQEQLDSAQDAG
ncbi:ABC transporter substrate-binding protein [Brachybacterium sp. AOP29-B2-41]|uniref:ABC transporter substrate-binding protein n=1 Tax=Brachybacterium sp. AOP29-B2-41 TaxID=3457704 RepID=UPI004033971E